MILYRLVSKKVKIDLNVLVLENGDNSSAIEEFLS